MRGIIVGLGAVSVGRRWRCNRIHRRGAFAPVDRLFDLDVRRLVQLLVRSLPRLGLVGGLWGSVGARGIVRSGVGGMFVIMAIVHMRRALLGAHIRAGR